jgi:hypothetical protein
VPMVINSRLRLALCRIAALTCFGVLASTGVALASCPPQPVTTPFTQWGDNNNYFPVPGGTFEGPSNQLGWNLSNASVTSGNEPFYVNSSSDDQSLIINGGGSATSPFFCVDNSMQTLRFFAQEAASGAGLHVRALMQMPGGGVISLPLANLADGSMPSWAPTLPISAASAEIPGDSTLMVALRFSVPASGSSWQIDDLYFDPYRSG